MLAGEHADGGRTGGHGREQARTHEARPTGPQGPRKHDLPQYLHARSVMKCADSVRFRPRGAVLSAGHRCGLQ